MVQTNSPVAVIDSILNEIVQEQKIPNYLATDEIKTFIREAIYEINYICGHDIDYSDDLHARRIVKSYVLYARHLILAEWKELYLSDITEIQEKYYQNTVVS